MNVNWSYDWITIIMVLVLLALVVVLEMIRGRVRGRILRIIASLVMGFALYALINPPILTKDAPTRSLLINLDGLELPDSLSRESIVFDSFDQWLGDHQNFTASPLQIMGAGMSNWQLKSIKEPFMFIPTVLEEGIIGVSSQEVFEGTPFRLRGDLLLRDSIQLMIIAPDNSSVTIPIVAGQNTFEEQMTIQVAGNHLVKLLGVRSEDTIFSEVYPVYVQPKPEISVLVLSGFPTFELRFLTEWMTERGYLLTLHQQTGQDLYVTRYLNQENRGKFQLNSDSFSIYQLMVLDQAYAMSLSKSQLETLLTAVRTGGCGLILLGALSDLNKKLPVSIEERAEKNLDLRTTKGIISLESARRVIKGKPIKLDHQPIARKVDYGIGTILQPEISNSYVLKLQGLEDEYHKIWQQLMTESIGRVASTRGIAYDPYTRLGRRSSISFDGDPTEAYYLGRQRLSIRQSELFPERLMAEVWPELKGWNPLIGQDTLGYLYVHPDSAWQTRDAYLKQRATLQESTRSQDLDRKVNRVSQPVSIWIWYGLLLLALGILWLEHRMNA